MTSIIGGRAGCTMAVQTRITPCVLSGMSHECLPRQTMMED